MDAQTQVADRSPLVPVLTTLLTLGLLRAAARISGLAALLVVVIACVGAFAIGIVVLRIAVLH